jgi:tetratricopeptide (TPR) repeat protein
MWKITTPAQLDQMINMGTGFIDPSILSPEMKQLLELYNAGTNAMNRGALGEAIGIYRGIVSTWPDFVAGYVNLAACLSRTGKPQQAIQVLGHAHGLAPQDPDIHLTAGQVYEALGDKQKEIEQYYQALEDDPNNVHAMNNLGIAYREVGWLNESRHWLQQAMQAVEQQESLMTQAGWQHPIKLNLLVSLALTYEAGERWNEAIYYWQQCSSLAPNNASLQKSYQRALSLARASRLRSSLLEFLDRVGGIPEDNRDPRFGHINEQLRAIFCQMPVTDICRELEHEVRKRPNGRAYKLLGFAYFHAGDLDSAIHALQASLGNTIEDPIAIYETLGYCYILKDDWITAEKWFACSDRYDLRGLVTKFGKDFVYISALGKQQEGSPIFGLSDASGFVEQYRKLNTLAMMTNMKQADPEHVQKAATELRQSLHSSALNDVPAPFVFLRPYRSDSDDG